LTVYLILGKLYTVKIATYYMIQVVQFSVRFCRKGVSMDTLDTPLDPPLKLNLQLQSVLL